MNTSSGFLKKAPSLLALGALVLAPLAALQAAGGPSSSQPNILFVLADQWRAQATGYAGNPNVKTPNLDALERQSVNFTHAISGVPVCCPARASFLTGQRVLTHGVFMNDVPLNPQAITLAKVLRAEGYDTGYIGKWHLNAHGRSNFIRRERRQGFDYWKVLECTHSYSNSFYYADGPEKLKWDGYDAFAQTDDAVGYLRSRSAADRPFFLYLAWGPPHDPYHIVPAKFKALYPPEPLKLRPNVPEAMQEPARRMLSGYYAHCTALDECVGQLMAALREGGLEQNTIVLFTSDHGDLLGSHGGRNKQQPYDESIRVPFLLRWPVGLGTRTSGRRLNALINSEDIMPTLLGLCEVRIPTTVEGLDFSGYIRGGKDPSDGAALISCVAPFGQWPRARGGKEYRGLRTDRYTYVRDLDGPWLLFDNESDPYQTNNLVGRSESSRIQRSLDARLRKKLKKTTDSFQPGDFYLNLWDYKTDATGTVPYTP